MNPQELEAIKQRAKRPPYDGNVGVDSDWYFDLVGDYDDLLDDLVGETKRLEAEVQVWQRRAEKAEAGSAYR